MGGIAELYNIVVTLISEEMKSGLDLQQATNKVKNGMALILRKEEFESLPWGTIPYSLTKIDLEFE